MKECPDCPAGRDAIEAAAKRRAEVNRRNQEARRRANIVMHSRHPDEWQSLMRMERAVVDEERGPLP